MAGKKTVSVSTSEILVQYTVAELTGHHTWASYIDTTVWSIIVEGRSTVLLPSIEEQKNLQYGQLSLELHLFATVARTNGIVFLHLVFNCQILHLLRCSV